MTEQIGFIIKVFGLSTLLSFLIKYGGPYLPVLPPVTTSIIAISAPPLIMAGILLWRLKQENQE